MSSFIFSLNFFLFKAPTGPPENVSVNVFSSTEIKVSWNEVAEIDRFGVIIEYEVMYEPLVTFGVLTVLSSRTSNQFIIISGLQEDIQYNISVRAYTSVGPGPYSVENTNRTLEDGE